MFLKSAINMNLGIVTFNRKAGKELITRCLIIIGVTLTALTLTQEGSSTSNQIPLALYQVQTGPVGLTRLHLHLQIVWTPRQAVVLSCILMVAAQRMVEMVPGLVSVYTGVLRIPGTCLSVHV